MKLGKTVASPSLNGVSCVGAVFPQSVLALCWCELWLDIEGQEPESGVSQGLSYPQWLKGGSQGARAESLRLDSKLVLFPLDVHSPHYQL